MTRGEVRSVVVRERAGCAIAAALNDDRGRAVFSYNDGAASANAAPNAARGGKVSRADMAAEVGRGVNQRRQDMYISCGSIDRSIEESLLRDSSDDVALRASRQDSRNLSNHREDSSLANCHRCGHLPPRRDTHTRHTHAARETTEISHQRRVLDTPSPGNTALRSLLTSHGLLSMQQQRSSRAAAAAAAASCRSSRCKRSTAPPRARRT